MEVSRRKKRGLNGEEIKPYEYHKLQIHYLEGILDGLEIYHIQKELLNPHDATEGLPKLFKPKFISDD